MKFFHCSVDIGYSWKELAQALFQRYPNPFSKHVLTEDVLSRTVSDDGKLYTVKLITKTNSMPRWGERFYSGPKFVTVIEESVVDPAAQTFVTYTRNITMNKFMSCTEKCVYSGVDSGQSQISKKAWLDSSMGYGLSIPILEFAIQRYKSNQHKATMGLEYAITHRAPPTLRDMVRQKKEHLTETAIHSKDYLSQKARKASEIARSKAKSEIPKVNASEV